MFCTILKINTTLIRKCEYIIIIIIIIIVCLLINSIINSHVLSLKLKSYCELDNFNNKKSFLHLIFKKKIVHFHIIHEK